MNIKKSLLVWITSCIFYSSFSQAGLITFDEVSPQGVSDQTFTLADYQFISVGNATINNNSCGMPRCADNGTQSLVMNVLDQELGGFTLSRIDGSAFNLFSFDAAETFGKDLHSFRWAKFIQLTATKSNGASFVQAFALDWINDSDYGDKKDFENFSLGTEFSNLMSVNFMGIGGDINNGFSIDNINVQAVDVPEPASLLLLSLALAILPIRRKAAKAYFTKQTVV